MQEVKKKSLEKDNGIAPSISAASRLQLFKTRDLKCDK